MLENINVQPLSKVDYYYLDTFFKKLFLTNQSLNLTRVHGYLTAIISAPTLIKPSDWTSLILGSDTIFENLFHAEKVMNLILELYNQINSQLKGDEGYQVLLWDGQKCQPLQSCSDNLIRDWCDGYLQGVQLDPLWSSDLNAVAMLMPFKLLARKHSFIGSLDSQGNLINSDIEFIVNYKAELLNLIEDNYSYWLQEREEELRLSKLRNKRIRQRQSSCPCGSNIKFNDCCYEESAILH